MQKFLFSAFLLSLVALLSSCYQVAPEEGSFRNVPATNNPHNITDSGRGPRTPGFGY